MVLLASAYDQTRFLKSEDLPAEKKFKIKLVTEEEIGIGRTRNASWSCGSPTIVAALS